MGISGAPAALKVGGATSSGPAPGIYRVKVVDASTGASSQKGTPFLALEFHVHKDPEHAAKEGKKLITQRFYFPGDDADAEKVKSMRGMLKRNLYGGFGLPWPKEEKALDTRVFVGKEVFVSLGFPSKVEEGEDARVEVRRIALDRADLEPKGEKSTEAAAEKPAARPRGR